MVRFERFVSNCNKESHGSGAGVLLGWYTEELGLKLRKNAELNEVFLFAGTFGGQGFEPWLLKNRSQKQ